MPRLILSLIMLFACSDIFAQATNKLRSNQTDTLYGVPVQDPYRALEDTGNVLVKQWMRQQEDKTTKILNSMPGRAKLLQKLVAYNDSLLTEEISDIGAYNQDYYAVKRLKGSDNFNLYKIDQKGKQTLYLDPIQRHPEIKSENIRIYQPVFNKDGSYMMYVLTVSGDEQNSQIHYLDMKSGKNVKDSLYSNVSRQFLAFDPADTRAFYYLYQPKFGDTLIDPRFWFDSSQVMHHIIGADNKSDKTIISFDTTVMRRGVGDPLDFIIREDLDYVFAISQNQVNEEYAIWFAKRDQLNGLKTPWQQISTYEDKINAFEATDDYLYLLTNNNAHNSKLLRVDLKAPSLQSAMLLVPETNNLIQSISLTKDQLIITALAGGTGKVYGIKHGSTHLDSFPLPVNGFPVIQFARPEQENFIVRITSHVETPSYYSWSPHDRKFASASVQQDHVKMKNLPIEVKTVMVPGWDGTRIPMTIIHKRGLKLDGSHPVTLRGYGAYGMQDIPSFWPEDIIWYEMGGIRAIAHVRGGGAYGETWHLAGKEATKPNTWKDFISAAEYLIKHKYATPKNLGITGGSAGGITVGRALTERPDLFATALIRVGGLDMVRFELSPNGLANVPEFGSVSTEAGFRALYAMSAYHHVKKGVKYPAVMIVHGVNDSRVPVYNSTKMAAILQESTASGKPILLRLNYDSGHGAQQTLTSILNGIADNYSFYLWQTGVKEFQPTVSAN